MKIRFFQSLALALSLGVSGVALAQQAVAPAPAAPTAAAPAAAAPAADNNTVVAKVTTGGKTIDITLGKIRERKKSLPPQIQEVPEKDIFAPLRDSTIDMELISLKAKEKGLDKDPEVVAKIKNCEEATLQKAFLDSKIAEKAKTKEGKDELKKVFDEFIKSMPKTDEVRLRNILVKTEKEAKDVLSRLKKGEDFTKVAEEVSIDETKSTGGDLGYRRIDEMRDEFAEPVKKASKATVIQQPIKTPLGYHILKVEDKRPATPPTYEQVEPELIQFVAPKFAKEIIEGLRAEASKIEKFGMDGKPEAAAAPKAEEKKDAAAPAAPAAK
jgi:peptidyl-prolyl cis-trans isomerase C